MIRHLTWEWWILAIGLPMFIAGQYLGLYWAPPDQHMREVARILFVHVPAAWIAMVCFLVAFIAAVGSTYVKKESRTSWDGVVHGAVETGVVLSGLLLALGSLFARPTWGVWWEWDPRLTASAIMWLTFIGVLILRQMLDEPERRATWTAIATIIAFINIPITYLSVRLWRSIHQVQSSPSTMSNDMVFALRFNAFAFLFLAIWLIARSARASNAKRRFELGEAPAPAHNLSFRANIALGIATLLSISAVVFKLPTLLFSNAENLTAPGSIQGGWPYILSAYGLTVLVLACYTWILLLRPTVRGVT